MNGFSQPRLGFASGASARRSVGARQRGVAAPLLQELVARDPAEPAGGVGDADVAVVDARRATTQWFPSQCTIAGSGSSSSRLFEARTERASRPSSSAPRVIPARLVPSVDVCTAERIREMLTARPK